MRAAFLLSVGICASVGPAFAAPEPKQPPTTSASDWSDESGADTAGHLIDQCLAGVARHTRAQAGEIACLDAAFHPCQKQNDLGMSQHGMNRCQGFSRDAWRARYDAQLARSDRLLSSWAKRPPDSWEHGISQRFSAQEKEWQRWMLADCDMRELGSVGGSIHNYAVASCVTRHIALRTIDLTRQLDWWETR